jgi:type I restriction enzyme S subunit
MTYAPLKRFVDPVRPITYGIVQAGEDVPDGVPYIRPVDMFEHEGVLDPTLLRKTSPQIAATYQRSAVATGDVVVSIGPSFGKTMVVPGILNGANLTQGTARVAPAVGVNARYLRWALRSNPAREHWEMAASGATFRALNLGPLSETPIWVWPPESQEAIADYLDRETGRIGALIAAKRRTIELLDERDLALVSNILFPDAVPVVRLGYLATLQTGLTVDAARDPGPSAVIRPYLRVANVQAGWLDLNDVSDVTISASLASRSTLRPGDVLMTEGGDLDKLGRGAIWQGQLSGCLHQNHIFAVRPDPKRLDPTYLALLTRTSHARRYFESTGSRTTNLASTNSEKILGLPVPRLALSEQSKLVALYEASSKSLRTLHSEIETQTCLLDERRQALITVAVTGEIEIPTAAA